MGSPARELDLLAGPAAEDAVQEAVVEALRVWPAHPPRDPRAWPSTVAVHRLVDARRSESARRAREEATAFEQPQGPTEHGDDTLLLLLLCCHPDLSPASQVALTLRAVGSLTTREIADAFFVPEATMAQLTERDHLVRRAAQARARFEQPGSAEATLTTRRQTPELDQTPLGRTDEPSSR